MGPDTRVLVTGASGQVGKALQSLRSQWTYLSRNDLDVTDVAAMRRVVSEPCVVIHLAAFTNVDGCEAEPARARAVNASATEELAERAREVGARVVYLSTDYVFDGGKASEYSEDDLPAPLNEYGRTKLQGEKAVGMNPHNLIVRTSWVFGNGRNFIRSILKVAAAGSPVEVVADQRGRPTAAPDLAQALVRVVEDGHSGIVHIAGDDDPVTWADLARLAFEAAGLKTEVVDIDSDTYSRKTDRVVAARPKNSVLSLDRARSLSLPLFAWRDSAVAYVKEIA